MLRAATRLAPQFGRRAPLLSVPAVRPRVARRAASTWNPFHRFVRSDMQSAGKATAVQVALVSGGVVTVYVVSKAFLTLTSTFMNMNFTTAASIGFVAGFASAGACSGLLYAAHRFTSIRPEQVYKLAFKTLRHDPRVNVMLGRNVRSGKLRAYKIDGGYFGPKDGTFGWQPPRVQMLFQVQGEHDDGIATVEAIKRRGATSLTLLAFDSFTADGRVLEVLHGQASRLHVVGQLRGFLQTERAQYIAQDVEDDIAGELDEADEELDGTIDIRKREPAQ